jgi:glutamine synthetase
MHYECKSPEDLLKTIKDEKIEMIDLRFTDIPGLLAFLRSASSTRQ